MLPLLSDRCFACHGPDDQARKGRLDLHTREGALRGGRSREPAIVPGNPDASELLARILASDPNDVMPPPEAKLPPFTPEETDRLRRWIEQGAEFKEHWAFLPIVPPAIPALDDSTPPAVNDIDRFVRTRHHQEGLPSQPEAAPETLLRRVTLDLIGLPPTPDDIAAFLADPSPAAYEAAVDRLLASPHYGERMTQEWLDLARYADTYGYQSDVDHDLSPWRDWVLRAFNENLPWDDFITWQLAGDLLDQPSPDQILATAFNRLHRQTNEGGSIEEEFRAEYVADRVHTMGTAFLGLTLECARCHDHKYDPISQRDYYRLFAFFNSIDESGLYSHFTRATPTPVMRLWEGDTERRHRELLEARLALEDALTARRATARPRFERWLAHTRSSEPPPVPDPVAHLPFETIENHRTPDSLSTNLVRLHDNPELVPGRVGQAMKFSGDNSAVLPRAGRFGRTDPFTFSLWLQPADTAPRAVVFHASRSWTDSGSRGYELVLEHGHPFFGLIHFWPGNAAAVRTRDPLPPGVWSHLTVTYDGSGRAAGIRIYRDGLPLPLDIVRDHLAKDIQHRAEWGDSDVGGVPLTLAGRFRDNGFKDGLIDEFRVFNAELTPVEVALHAGLPHPLPSLPETAWLAHFLARHDDASLALRARWHEVLVAENNLVTPVREIMVMQDLPEPRPTFVLQRGAYDSPGDAVQPGTPDRLMPMDPGLPRNRLGLARWITDPAHPLTARVAVNRIWKHHFGQGLVGTTWDFGAQGELPSHPELLDWLAHRFVSSGWDRKALHRLIVTSATYRQASSAPPNLLARDPENRLLARGPRHRLDAEQIRDGALAASGLLVPTLGGPAVKPYQPPGVWEDAGTGKSYTQDKGDKLYRRSLYTFWRRTAPPPSMLTFDATSREVCTSKRDATTTPLQSLVLLNDTQFVEAARVLAERLLTDHPHDPAARAQDAFLRLVGRAPDDLETDLLALLYTEQRAHFRAHPDDAEAFVAIGERPRDPSLPAPELAATTVLTSAVMNHDEFVMKR
ncbi:MAG: DUF1553 domain-containing protein [Verrucomicrobiae bacterium]|nr:DUF1553 domain-containing protein [Verrucomicrobiae bacterium]